MCHSVIFATVILIVTNSNADSSEDPQTFTYYAPPTLNFQDIANDLALLDDSTMSNLLEDDSFHIKQVHPEFVEFQTQTMTPIPLISSTLNPGSTSTNNATAATSTTVPTSTTTEESEAKVKVLPIAKKTKYQRGVLDLLFPATRVKNFKSVFDTVRRLLSHTF